MQKKAELPTKQWVLYVLRCNDNTLYCGITNNLPARVGAHNRGKGARYTKGRGPVVLVKSWPATDMSAALKAERAFKSMTRVEKEKKIRNRSRRGLDEDTGLIHVAFDCIIAGSRYWE